jgi:hypothetical protein
MQQTELEIKKADVQRKTQKDQIDSQIAMQKLQLEKERIDGDIAKEMKRIQSQELQAKARIQSDMAIRQLESIKGKE